MDEYHTVYLQVGMSYLTRLYSKCEPDKMRVFANGHLLQLGQGVYVTFCISNYIV